MADEAGTLYLAHAGGLSKWGFRKFLADGVWQSLAWPAGEETEAVAVILLASSQLIGRFVDSVRRFKEDETLMSESALSVAPSLHSTGAACAARWSTCRFTRNSASADCSAV